MITYNKAVKNQLKIHVMEQIQEMSEMGNLYEGAGQDINIDLNTPTYEAQQKEALNEILTAIAQTLDK